MTKNVYTVKQVNAYIKNMFTQDFMLSRIYVKGEVSNCKYHTSGHIYFSLKDESGTIACVMFAGQRGGLSFRMSEGQQVVVFGSVNVYERSGSYQLYAREIRLDGEGRLYERFQALKRELEEMGMFAPEYKKEINLFWNHLELAITQFSYTKEWISNMKKEGLHVYILSNYGDWTYQRTKDNALDFLLLTDGDIFSYSVRQVKPDVEIYETLLKKYQLTADECVFIDDRMENIEGAEKAGIHGICFETIGQVKEDLKKYNIYV